MLADNGMGIATFLLKFRSILCGLNEVKVKTPTASTAFSQAHYSMSFKKAHCSFAII